MNRTMRIIVIAVVIIGRAWGIVATAPVLGAGADRAPKIDALDLSFYRASMTTQPYPLTSAKRVKNVILCIGDGMGINQVALARVAATGLQGKLYMERMPVTGLVRTHAANALVTDSAASGTALAAGVKTKNGMIGMSHDERAYHTILEMAKAKGMATGLVATSSITHATPASFASHVQSRKMENRIAEHLIGNRVNVLFGGGRKFFLPKSAPHSAREDEKDLITRAKNAGYEYIETARDLRRPRQPYVLGLFQLEALTTEPPEPSLALLTKKAIRTLKRANSASSAGGKGFFLMVEGSQIDWACHDNDADQAVRQTLLFDQAVQVTINFAMKNGRTLVIVTADHETGGLTFTSDDKKSLRPKVHWSTKGHSGSPVPIYALGPGAEVFAGVCDNTEIPSKLARLLDIRPFPQPAE